MQGNVPHVARNVWLSGNNTYYYNIYIRTKHPTHTGKQRAVRSNAAHKSPIPDPMPFIFVPVTDIASVARAWGARCTGVERALHERGARVARPCNAGYKAQRDRNTCQRNEKWLVTVSAVHRPAVPKQ